MRRSDCDTCGENFTCSLHRTVAEEKAMRQPPSPQTAPPTPTPFDNEKWHEDKIEERWAELLRVLEGSPVKSEVLGIVHVLRNSEHVTGRYRPLSEAREPATPNQLPIETELGGGGSPGEVEGLDDEEDRCHHTALEVLCRVFEDGADRGMDEWREWYKPSQWMGWERALGAFIVTRLADKDGERRRHAEECQRLRTLLTVERARCRDLSQERDVAQLLRDGSIEKREELAAKLAASEARWLSLQSKIDSLPKMKPRAERNGEAIMVPAGPALKYWVAFDAVRQALDSCSLPFDSKS